MRSVAVLLLVIMLACAAPYALAQNGPGHSFSADQAKTARDRGDIVPLGSIFRKLKARYGGYQIDANLYNRQGGQIYVIDWMTAKAERLQITVDARTGRILS